MIAARRAVLPALAAALIAEAVLLRVAVSVTFDERQVLRYECGALGIFVVALVLLAYSGLSGRTAVRAVLAVGGLMQLIMLSRPPADSDDDYRYLWDAKVQLAGIDPYRDAPSSPALAHLRDGFLFPTAAHCGQHPIAGGCTRINLPNVHTIYPPVAEAIFALLRLLSFGDHGQHLPLQIAAALGAMTVSWLLARRAVALGLPLWSVALWAWCPVMLIELGNNAHIDWLAVLLSVVALTVARGRPVLVGVLLGGGIATKLYPGLIGAALLRRRPVAIVVAATATVVLVYLPHVVAVGGAVLGYLPDYLRAGGYGSGRQYRLLAWALPHVVVTPLAVAIVVAVAAWAMLRGDPDRPERSALIVVGVAVLVSTPPLPWYLPLLLALAALNARPEWLGVVIAPTIVYLVAGVYGVSGATASTLAYGAGLVVLLIGTLIRRSVAPAPAGKQHDDHQHDRGGDRREALRHSRTS